MQSVARKCCACHADYPLNSPAHPFRECQIKPAVELERTESCLYIGDENDQRNSGEVVDIRDYESGSAPVIYSIMRKTTASTAQIIAHRANGLTHIKVQDGVGRLDDDPGGVCRHGVVTQPRFFGRQINRCVDKPVVQ